MKRSLFTSALLGAGLSALGFPASATPPCSINDRVCDACVIGAKELVRTKTVAELVSAAKMATSAQNRPSRTSSSYVFPSVVARSLEGVHLAHVECVLNSEGDQIASVEIWFRETPESIPTTQPISDPETAARVKSILPHLRGKSKEEIAAAPTPRLGYASLDNDAIASINSTL